MYSKILEVEINVLITLKCESSGCTVSLKRSDRMVNSVDTDQTAPMATRAV